MIEIEIVSLSPEEWPLYKEMRLEALRLAPAAFSTKYEDAVQSPDSYWEGRLRSTQGGSAWMLFARMNNRLVGLTGAYYQPGSETAEIVSVYVSPEARGQGVGQALMEAILAALEKVPSVRRAVLGVSSDQTPAVALYKKMGFVVVGERTGEMGDGKVQVGYDMEKVLRE